MFIAKDHGEDHRTLCALRWFEVGKRGVKAFVVVPKIARQHFSSCTHQAVRTFTLGWGFRQPQPQSKTNAGGATKHKTSDYYLSTQPDLARQLVRRLRVCYKFSAITNVTKVEASASSLWF